MENTPKKVFILEDGKYKEITNTEHSKRRKNENAYKKRKFIRMGNCLMEVTYENYKEGLTEQKLADRQGVRQQTIHKKKKRILNKLRAIMKLLEDE